jgi:hypothetical protein
MGLPASLHQVPWRCSQDGHVNKAHHLNCGKVIADNFGVAILDHATNPDDKFIILPWHKVWHRLGELKAKNGGKSARVLRNGQIIKVTTGTYKGIWTVFSVKNNSGGVALDIGFTDVVTLRNKTEGHKINASFSTLVKGGLEILKPSLCGVAQAAPAAASA